MKNIKNFKPKFKNPDHIDNGTKGIFRSDGIGNG